MAKAYLKFKDVGGIETLTWLKDLDGSQAIAAVASFANSVFVFGTNAAITEYGLVRPQFGALNGGTANANSSVKNKARCVFNYINGNNEVKVISLWIPAPNMTMFTNVEGVGYRMNPANGTALQGLLRTLTGNTAIDFQYGVLDYSEAKDAAHSDNAIEFSDVVENTCWMSVPQPTSLAALQTFGNAMAAYTIGIVTRCVYMEYESAITPTGSGMATPSADINGLDSVERRCVCKFTYIEGTVRRSMTMIVPAPQSARLVYQAEKQGYALNQVSGDTLATAITTLYGAGNRDVRFRKGFLKMKELQNQ